MRSPTAIEIIEATKRYAEVRDCHHLFAPDPCDPSARSFILNKGICFALAIINAVARKQATLVRNDAFKNLMVAWSGDVVELSQIVYSEEKGDGSYRYYFLANIC